MINKFSNTLQIIKKASIRYPLMLLCSLILTLCVQQLIEVDPGKNFWLIRLAFTAGWGISLFFALEMLAQRTGRQWLWRSVGILLLLSFYFLILPANQESFTEKYAFILIPLFILSHLGVAVAPYFSKKEDEAAFWEYNKTLFIHLFLTAVFTGVLAGGIQLALLAIDHLFGINWSSEAYVRVFFSIVIMGSTLIFALFNLDELEKMEARSPYPVVIQFFTQFILIPLLLLYAGILYLYGSKILVEWEMPRGWVSYLILAYAVLGILALLLVHPLLGSPAARSWVDWFRKLFYYSLLPLLILLYTAIGLRIGQYGFTEPRYFVLLLALWLTGVSLYFIIHPKPRLKLIPVSLLLVGIFSLVTPYLNVLSVGVRSQKNALERLLSDNQLIENNRIDFSKPVTNLVTFELQDKYQYLKERDAHHFFLEKMDPDSRQQVLDSAWKLRELFTGVLPDSSGTHGSYVEIISQTNVYDITDYQHLTVLEYQQEVNLLIGSDSLYIRRSLHESPQVFTVSTQDQTLDLLPLINQWVLPYQQAHSPVEVSKIEIPFQIGHYQGKMLMDRISIQYNPGSPAGTVQTDRTVFVFSNID